MSRTATSPRTMPSYGRTKSAKSRGEYLTIAKEKIATQEKWHKGAFVSETTLPDGTRAHCVGGALCDEISVNREKKFILEDGVRLLWEEIPESFGEGSARIANFNDHPDTTHEMVMELFDRAIEKANKLDAG